MIYTLGCSFTKWYWHTWSDWLAEYVQQPVTNLAWPGLSNQTMYWELFNRCDTITAQDQVYVMLTGANRSSAWFDPEWITTHDCRGFFPDPDGQLEFGNQAWYGMYRLPAEFDPSVTHQIIENFNVIYQMQQLLNNIGCKYHMMFWQNPWYDVRPRQTPIWHYVWPEKQGLTRADQQRAQTILSMQPVRNLLNSIDWTRFYQPPTDIQDPKTYQGMWEYKAQLQTTEDYLQYAHQDPHPDAVIQHDYVADVILGLSQQQTVHRDLAMALALESKKHDIDIPRRQLIQNDLSRPWPKLYK